MPLRSRSPRRTLLPLATALAAITGAPAPARAQEPPPPSPMTLADVVALAKERAPAVHAALARIASAEAGVDRSRAAHLPSVYVQGAGTGFATNGQVYSGGVVSSAATESYVVASGALNLAWTLYDFGHTSSAIDAATAGVTSATLSAKATEQVAMAEAAVAFFTLLADDELIRSFEAARADRDHVVTLTHHLVEGGYRTPVDETRAKIALDVADIDLSLAKGARDSDSVTLANALSLEPQTAFHLTAPAPLAVDESAAMNGTVALRARKDVAAAAARVDQARFGVDAAKHAHLPVLSANAAGQLLYAHDTATYAGPPSQTQTTDGPTELVQGTLTLTVPLFDSLVNANVRAAEASLGEAKANLEQISLSARGDALQASRQARTARAVLDQSQRLAEGTAANLAAVEDRYATGIESPLALADAQREERNARVAIVRARLAFDVAAVKLLAGLSRADDLLKVR